MSTANDDLNDKLAEALEALAEKERDLIMAAEFGQSLLQANARLQQQLAELQAAKGSGGDDESEVAVLKRRLRETEKNADRQIQALNRQTQTLTQDLRAALNDHKRSEAEHAKQVRMLEADLEALMAQVGSSKSDSAAAVAASNVTTAFATSSVAAVTATSDDETILQISKLQDELAQLNQWKVDAEKTIATTTATLQESIVRLHDQEDRLQAAASMRQEFERRGTLIIQLREQVEDLRARLDSAAQEEVENGGVTPAADGRSLAKVNSDIWEWTPWLENVKYKAWERDLAGLREEVEDLRRHREEAYNKLKAEMDAYMLKFVDSLPESVKLGVGKVVNAVTVPLAGISTAPERLSGGSKVEEKLETITTIFPNVPREAIEKDLSATRSVRLTIENILSGFISPTTQVEVTEEKLQFTIANPEE
ncbi:hypothetical protein HDU83_009491 [Entophlyctis luteolus]|nr:hypothetical protein HDU83_009491 [Entophlyctis luteolus]KAJ3388199.1 hypothetical protein HDU84_000198 [Entophlyctis sp. JEL0112]